MKKIILVAALLSAAVCLPAQNKGGNKSGGNQSFFMEKSMYATT